MFGIHDLRGSTPSLYILTSLLLSLLLVSVSIGGVMGAFGGSQPTQSLQSVPVCGIDSNELDEGERGCLAERYSPVLNFHADEQYRPTSVSKFVEAAEVDEGTADLQEDASLETIADRESEAALILENSASYTDYGSGGLPRVVYANVTKTTYEYEEYIAVSYWMFYFHDPKKEEGISQIFAHQSDFETLTLLLNESGVQYAAGSQHFGGERRPWEAVEKWNQTHPLVYPSFGSHSVYFTNTEEYGPGGIAGREEFLPDESSTDPLGGLTGTNAPYRDVTGNASVWGGPEPSKEYELRMLSDDEPWQRYSGSFARSLVRNRVAGQAQAPAHRDRWKNPGEWVETLAPYSELVIPDGGWTLTGGLLAGERGNISDKTVNIRTKVWNAGTVPSVLYANVTVYSPEGELLGQKVRYIPGDAASSASPNRFLKSLNAERTIIKVPVSESHDSVDVEVEIYTHQPSESSAPSRKFNGTVCNGLLCGF